jgi:preprotein translocase subunit SecE
VKEMATEVKEKTSFFGSIATYFKELKAETKRITWPSKEDFKKATLAVIVFCLIWIAVVTVMDFGLRSLFENFVFKIKL